MLHLHTQASVAATCIVHLAKMPSPEGSTTVDDGILIAHTTGAMALPVYLTVLSVSRTACERVAEFMRNSLTRQVS